MIDSKIKHFFNNKFLNAFLFYSLFRAVYGVGILFVTWIFATHSFFPSWSPLAFLLFSLFFSRFIFSKLNNNKINQ